MDNPRQRTPALAELVPQFLTDRATLTRRGLSAASRRAYLQDLTAWAGLIAEHKHATGQADEQEDATDPLAALDLDDLTQAHLKAAYRHIREHHAASTAQRRIGTLKLFCNWAQLEGLLDHDPTLRLEAPIRPARLPAGWDEDELARLAATVATPPEGNDKRRWPERDWAAFALLATTGMRAAELCALTDRHIKTEGGEVTCTITGKGNKQRTLPLPPETLTALEVYRTTRTTRVGDIDADTPTLRLANGKPLTTSALAHLVETWIRRAGVTKHDGETAHAFRHTFAKSLIRDGISVPAVQELLGHTDLRTTGIYVKATAADVRDAVWRSAIRGVLAEHAPERMPSTLG